jgi:hypothetical protein
MFPFAALVTASSVAILLSACGSSTNAVDEGTGQEDNPRIEVESSPNAQPTPTFYLDLLPGCYSYTREALAAFPIESTAKEMYETSCSAPHHFEVFESRSIPGFDGSRNLSQADAEEACTAAYVKRFGAEAPRVITPPDQLMKTPYLIWYFPDDGLEASQYPGKIVCAGVVAIEGGIGFEVINEPFATLN